jgi:transposase-like protein
MSAYGVHFHDEDAAYAFVEAVIWPEGPVCPRCGETSRVGALRGESTRRGTYKCYACRKPFTVKIGTALEGSNAPMHHWLRALYLMAESAGPLSTYRLHREVGTSRRTADLMRRRVEEALYRQQGQRWPSRRPIQST